MLNCSTPQGLLNAVFFLNGKNFLLRGGSEHRFLKISQFSKNVSLQGRVSYTYTENVSKNRSGGFCQRNVDHKVVHQFENPSLGDHVFVLDKYFSKLPKSAQEHDIFYLRPVLKIPEKDDAPWFFSVPEKYIEQNG